MPKVSIHTACHDIGHVDHDVPRHVIDLGWEAAKSYLEKEAGEDFYLPDDPEPDYTEISSAWVEVDGKLRRDELFVATAENDPSGKHPKQCPHCNADLAAFGDYGPIQIDGKYCRQECSCTHCNAGWNENYTASGIDDLEPPTQQERPDGDQPGLPPRVQPDKDAKP